MKIKLVSTFPPKKCGIAEHAERQRIALIENGITPEKIIIEETDTSNPFYFINLAKQTAKDMNEDDVIHIQFQLYIFGKLFWIFPGFNIIRYLKHLRKLTKAKIILELHDSPSYKYANSKKDKAILRYYKYIYKRIKKNVDIFITHSEHGREISMSEWGIDGDRVFALPLGIINNTMILDKEESKQKLNYSDKKVLLIFGYIRLMKNYSLVLEALKHLDDNVILLIVGNPQKEKDYVAYNEIVNKTKELGLDNRVKMLGYVKDEEMPVIFNAADVSITLHSQGSGDFLSSTMAMQLSYLIPSLSTNINSFENIKRNEGCIETFEENNVEDLVKKLSELLYNEDKIKELKEKSKEYCEKYNWHNIGKKLIEIYERRYK